MDMRRRLYEINCDFQDILYEIEDAKNVLEIVSDYIYQEERLISIDKLQSIVNTQIRLLEHVDKLCINLDNKLDTMIRKVGNSDLAKNNT